MRKVKTPVTIDYETYPIEAWPNYPPKPVGASIQMPREKAPKYFAWGHPTNNNCSEKDFVKVLRDLYKSKEELLFHNAKFDLDVAQVHHDMPIPDWRRIHDTMFMVFLNDPHSPNLKLKPTAERLLDMPPEELDILREWCIQQKLITRAQKEVGHLIYLAPGDLVGEYAKGDVIRTRKLYEKLFPMVLDAGMGEAYDRERRLLPILLANEHQGVPVNLKLMQEDDKKYTEASKTVDGWLHKQMKAAGDFNLDSPQQLAEALIVSKKADEKLFSVTGSGQRSVAKDSLIGAVTDKKVLQALQYRARLDTAHNTFLKPWLAEAVNCKAKLGVANVHPSWNQVRQAGHGNDAAGARSGRLSAARFLNVPKQFKERTEGANAYTHPSHIKGLPELPLMRRYMVPFKGHVWCKRDYMQQELRVLAHFGDGVLMNRFREDPVLDVHDLATSMVKQQHGLPVTRDDMKTVGFGLLYGMGLGELANRLNVDMNTAKRIRDAYLSIFPELKDLQDALKEYARSNTPLTTWGGRKYYVEPPKFMAQRNRMVTFEYKLLNYLIQGSSADDTKEAIIRYHDVKKDGLYLLAVHDEINMSVPTKAVKSEMQLLREVMASVEFDVPMLSDGATGPSWGDLTKFKEAPLVLPPWR